VIDEVEHVAKLACLAFSEEEKEKMREELSTILEHAGKISMVDTEGVTPTSHVIPLVNVFRDDNVTTSISIEEAMKNAPWATKDGFRVPRIV
jgi:aspartyl-tRNA(Asn)/glutamyl-tRNA(Gln) amidotransferase subunit C